MFLCWPMKMKIEIEGLGATNSSTISCRIRMSVLMTKVLKAAASTALTTALFATTMATRTNVRNRAIIITSGLATGLISAPIASIENRLTFMGLSERALIFFV